MRVLAAFLAGLVAGAGATAWFLSPEPPAEAGAWHPRLGDG